LALPPLVLASASPRRRYLLRLLGVRFEVVPSGIPEAALAGEMPRPLALRLARAKALAVSKRRKRRWVLGADTVVWAGGRPLGTPRGRREAAAMLRALSGRVHQVWTGVALVVPGRRRVRLASACTRVSVAPLARADIETYLRSGEWRDKAGAYGIQGRFAAYVRRIEGSYTNVVGLPLEPLRRMLRAAGLLEPLRGRRGASAGGGDAPPPPRRGGARGSRGGRS
jgi:septum formation protein